MPVLPDWKQADTLESTADELDTEYTITIYSEEEEEEREEKLPSVDQILADWRDSSEGEDVSIVHELRAITRYTIKFSQLLMRTLYSKIVKYIEEMKA